MPKPTIQLDINFQTESFDDRGRYEQAALWVARKFKLQRLDVSIAIVDDKTIHELNVEHLDHDWPTDVISFIFEADSQRGSVEGEIVASRETAERLAPAAGWTANDELLLYVIHGLLHLAGLDDIAAEQEQEMRAAEKECLLAMGVVGADNHIDRFDDVGD